MIAAFGDLEIGEMRRCEPEPRRRVIRYVTRPAIHLGDRWWNRCRFGGTATAGGNRVPAGSSGECLLHQVRNPGHLVDAHKGVHLGQQPGKFVGKPLRKTTGHDQGLAAALRLAHRGGFHDGIDALRFGRVDERAGVHHERVGFGGVVDHLEPAFEQTTQHDLAVHQVLGAPERNQPHANRVRRLMILGPAHEYLVRQGLGPNPKPEGHSGAGGLDGVAGGSVVVAAAPVGAGGANDCSPRSIKSMRSTR